MKSSYKTLIIVGFSVLYGMQAVMTLLLVRPDGIRVQAPVPGISVPLSTTVVGDAWMKGGVGSIEVTVRGADGDSWSVPAERDTIKYRGVPVSVLAGWHAAVTFKGPGAYTISATAASAADGRTLSTATRHVNASPTAVSRQFGFVSLPHIAAIAAVLAMCILVPVLVRRGGSDVIRDRVALIITLALWVHELVYEIYWFIIGAWTVGNALLLHMCGLALMFIPFVYFCADGRFRQYLFELLYFFGLGGAMQALFTPDIGMHGFPELKYFNYFFSHGTIILSVVYAASVYRLRIRWMSVVRIAVGTTLFCLVMFGVNRLFPLFPPYELGNYFVMGYPPPTGSIIDVFASLFGPAPRYLIGLEIMGAVVLSVITLPYWVRWLAPEEAARLRGTGTPGHLRLAQRAASLYPPPEMRRNRFFDSLQEEARRADSLLCIGLDPSLDIPTPEVFPRVRAVVEATHGSACAFKPNIAFYEARGAAGWDALRSTIDLVHSFGRLLILDAKRGDIASTADAYARACFDELDADAVTLNPLLGSDSVESFARRDDRGLFLLCHTSNPGARDLQEIDAGGIPLYERIARMAHTWNTRENIGLVAGATYPETLARVRAAAPGMWILLPGVGSQGGDLEASLEAGLDAGAGRVLVNVSRDVFQAPGPGSAAEEYRRRINAARRSAGTRPRVHAPARTTVDDIALGLHELGAVRFGDFTLKSGNKSPLYIDLRLLVSDPALMARAARAMAALLEGLRFDRIAALPYGGLPIGQAVSLASGKPLLYPRREAKNHGTKKLIEGTYAAGETVVVLDDLVTTGGSKIEAMEPLTEAGLKVTDVVVLVDREQGGRLELAGRGLTLHSVLTLSQLLDSLVQHGRIADTVRSDVRAALAIA